MLEAYPVVAWLIIAFIGLIAIAVCMNERNMNKYYNTKIAMHKGFCPFKYKWQLIDDLNKRNKEHAVTYLHTLNKANVKALWMYEVHGTPIN